MQLKSKAFLMITSATVYFYTQAMEMVPLSSSSKIEKKTRRSIRAQGRPKEVRVFNRSIKSIKVIPIFWGTCLKTVANGTYGYTFKVEEQLEGNAFEVLPNSYGQYCLSIKNNNWVANAFIGLRFGCSKKMSYVKIEEARDNSSPYFIINGEEKNGFTCKIKRD